jgi:hypothetical protein
VIARNLPPGFILPALLTIAPTVPTAAHWVHEIKHDGYRFICRKAGDQVRIWSRHGRDWTAGAAGIAIALAALQRLSSTAARAFASACGVAHAGAGRGKLLELAVPRRSAVGACRPPPLLRHCDSCGFRRQPYRRGGFLIRFRMAVEACGGGAAASFSRSRAAF